MPKLPELTAPAQLMTSLADRALPRVVNIGFYRAGFELPPCFLSRPFVPEAGRTMLFKRGKRLVGICPEEGTEGMNIRDPVRISCFEARLIHQHLMTSSILMLIKRLIQHSTIPGLYRIASESNVRKYGVLTCLAIWSMAGP